MNYEVVFLIALGITVGVETLGLWLLFRFWWLKKYRRISLSSILSASVIASTLTLPYLWFVFPAFIGRPFFAIAGEILIFIVEGLIYKRLLPIGYPRAFLASFILNIASMLTGRFLLPLFI